MCECVKERTLQNCCQMKNTSQSTDVNSVSSRKQWRTLCPYPANVFSPCFVLMTFLLCVPTSNGIPSLCFQPPPPPNCGGEIYSGVAYYYNSSSAVPCLRMANWGCSGDNMFLSIEDCMATCQPGENKKHE